MNEHESVNLLKPKTEHVVSPESLEKIPLPEADKRKRGLSGFVKIALFSVTVLFIGAFLFSSGIARTAPRDEGDSLSLFASLSRLVLSGDKAVAGENDDRINILLLGIGGSGHDGPELTDTMIFGSFKPSTGELGMISIPRDLTVNIPGYGYRKINHVNALAEQEERGSGPEAAADMVSKILGEEVHYTVKIDFNGFAEVIDALGGIDVYVERSFTDPQYPLDDGLGNIETLTFTQGWAHMDGATALKFARSRHGNNGEGTDFARAARQQKMLLAVKDKVLSLGVLLNPGKMSRIMGVIQDNVKTNMNAWEMMKFAKYVPDISGDKVSMHVLDATSGLLYETYTNGAYVLLPYEEDWSDLHLLADNIFEGKEVNANPVLTDNSKTTAEKVTVEIQNGTSTTGLASQTAQLLESSGFTVVSVTNAETKDFPTTVIYDFTDGKKDHELAALKDYLRAEVYMSEKGYLNAEDVVPDKVVNISDYAPLVTSTETVDFLVILGQDSTNLVLR